MSYSSQVVSAYTYRRLSESATVAIFLPHHRLSDCDCIYSINFFNVCQFIKVYFYKSFIEKRWFFLQFLQFVNPTERIRAFAPLNPRQHIIQLLRDLPDLAAAYHVFLVPDCKLAYRRYHRRRTRSPSFF